MRTPRSARLVFGALAALCPQLALADPLGLTDAALLIQLVANSFEEVGKAAEVLATARQTYDETKKIAGYADEAVRAFESFQNGSGRLFSGDVLAALDSAYPDFGYLRAEAEREGPWASGDGNLRRMVRYCIGGGISGKGCRELKEAMTLKDARQLVSGTFGTLPYDLESARLDEEAAVALAGADAQTARSAIDRANADILMQECVNSTGTAKLAACQAAANAAQIAQMKQNADMADQLAELSRLQALRLAQENDKKKSEALEIQRQRRMLRNAVDEYSPRPVVVKTDGFDPFE